MDLETLFTTELGFNVQDATPLQRSLCRVAWGLPVGELAPDADVLAAFGGADAVAALPVGSPPKELHIVGPSRAGKSKLAAADAVVAGQSVSVEGTDLGDIIRISFLGLTTRTNAIWTHLTERVANQPALRRLLVGDMRDSVFAMRHPTGRPIEYMLVPIDKWGGSVISVYSAGILIDEEPRQIGAEDGVKNWSGVHDASAGRLLRGAKFFGVGAPWAPVGPIFDLVNERFGKPGSDLVIVRGTGPMWNPSWWTPERCDDLERRNPVAYRSDVMGEFIDRASSLISAQALQRCESGTTQIHPQHCTSIRGAGIDPSDAEGGNEFALAIVDAEIVTDDEGRRRLRYRVCHSTGWRGVGIAVALEETAKICRYYGLNVALSDRFIGSAGVELAKRQHGLTIVAERSTTEQTVDAYTTLATLIATRDISIPPDPVLQRDLLGVRKIATAAGYKIDLPRTTDGRHADRADAVVAAIKVCSTIARTAPRPRPVNLPDFSEDDFIRPPLDANLLPPGMQHKR